MTLSSVVSYTKKPFIWITLGSFLLGILLASLYWVVQLRGLDAKNESAQLKIDQLSDQSKLLREELSMHMSPTPTGAPIPKGKKENLEQANLESLTCLSYEQLTNAAWYSSLKAHDTKFSNIYEACLNTTQQKIIYLSLDNQYKDGSGTPGPELIALNVKDLRANTVSKINNSICTFSGGLTSEIIAWTKTGNIYFKCHDVTGDLNTNTLYKTNLTGSLLEEVETCVDISNPRQPFEKAKTTCTTY